MISSKLLYNSSLRQIVRQAPRAFKNPIFAVTAQTRAMATEFKIKNLAALDLKPGEKRQVEVDGVEDGKVLLLNVGGKTTAVGARCTHYGAPLVKGVLTGDGRITCPWHGACFNATTGDIENAPALDNLPVFGLVEKDGGVYVTGAQDKIKGSRRKPNIKCSAVKPENIVVVGGGSGAIGTVEALREQGYKGSITLISNEGYLPIDRTKLSKALIADPVKIGLRDQPWFDEAGITTVTDEVTEVDFLTKKVHTRSSSVYPYTKLVLATGGTPRQLPLPGFKELGNIFVLRNIHNVKDILAAIGEKNKKIVVIGSSFIGMEVAKATSKDNTVSVVGMEKVPLERVMGEQVGSYLQKQLEAIGVKFHMNAGVDKALPSASDPSKVGAIQLKDGTKLDADLVILGVGVAPATEYLRGNKSVQLAKDGSLTVDGDFLVQGVDGVYAVGDIATYPYHGPGGNGAPVRIEHWNVAQNSGRAAAAHIVSPTVARKPFIPIFWSALGAQLRYCGNTVTGYDGSVVQGSLEEYKFAVFYTKGEEVVAVVTMGKDPVVSHASELMRRGMLPGKKELEGGLDILTIEVPAL
ncbi:hypothetical protein VE01_09974 [Pseudogymnoascus verrucosus]|uniref:Rieske domain-containing protein n=1 Tax=Pseudogymnoascus verrucosus TaxID=342668 RepID=A0A1B8G8T1_9PEZI|nr:uncharacterized protein VE01_09974 [Pseudogymnoascus verrucosus]OBT92243.2 hypothetical protein VE01_09974 [Pseudogymnoascus verrucosus]